MEKNRALYIDKETIATLSMASLGILYPVTGIMGSKEAEEVDKTELYNGKSFPFSFILAPSGKRNRIVLQNAKRTCLS